MDNPTFVLRTTRSGRTTITVRRPGDVVVHDRPGPVAPHREVPRVGSRSTCPVCSIPGGTYDHLTYGTTGDPYVCW